MTYPVSRASIVAGKLAPYLAVNLVQFALMLLVGLYVVPLFGDLSLQLGSHPGHLALVTLAAAMAATGYGALVASLARTIEQAGAFGATSIIVMAVVGGVMVPGFVMPQVMQKLAYLSPLYWGLQAYLDVLLREAPLAVIAPRLAALLLFSLACFAVAARRFRSV
jgi:ABC-2 type transport system permease protein